jgi:carbon-monoxide dehydrogenase large subunit
MSILGTRVARVEDPGFLTHGAVYMDDRLDDELAGGLHATFVRSPIAHARILSIDVSAALEVPGVVAVYTAADLLDDAPAMQPSMMPPYPAEAAHPLLATDTVRYVGEQVAVIIATDRYVGEDAAEQISIDYDPLPVVIDPKESVLDKELLFPTAGTNVIMGNGVEFDPTDFDGCEVVVSHEIINQRVAAAPLEVRSGAAVYSEETGRYTVWCSNQGAQGVRDSLAGRLGISSDLVRIITPAVGGGFGAKFGSSPEHGVIAIAAKKLGQPIRWIETRSENMLVMPQGRGQVQTATLGGSRDGKIAAFQLEVLQDAGAYGHLGGFLPTLTALMAPAVYAFPKVTTSWKSVVTNSCVIGAYRGAGRPEATAVIERAMDIYAAEIGMDPGEVRRINLLPAFDEPFKTLGGALYDNGAYEKALDLALASSDYAGLRKEQAERRERGDVVQMGIGLAVYVEVTGAGGGESGGPSENATVEIHPDGSATILTGVSPHGQGHETVWAMIASDELGIPMDKITLKWGDTDLIPEGGGTGGSRSLQQGGAAVIVASKDLIEIARGRAAERLEVDPGDLRLDKDIAGLSVAGVPGASITFAELANEERLFVRSIFEAKGATFPFGAHVAVVDVDTESGKVTLKRIIAVDDAGTVINPLLCEGQRHGGLAQGAAQALLEEVLYDADGNPNTTTFADYPIVSATELPSFELIDMATPTPYNPLGAKGIGEAGTIGSTPAVHNAVVDAVSHLGIRHIDMPTTPEKVWRAISAAKNGAA